MRLFVVRHAEAAPGDPDELRPLTAAGQDAARALAERLAGEQIDVILTSPVRRARETVEILEGYRKRDDGTVEVLGSDPQRTDRRWRERVGVVLQSSSLYPNLTVRESLDVFAGYYAAPRAPAEVIAIVGLDDKRDARVRTLSGGQK